jgi:hypothetical protein
MRNLRTVVSAIVVSFGLVGASLPAHVEAMAKPRTASTSKKTKKPKDGGTYTNVDGKKKKGPRTTTAKGSAKCGDGTTSTSDHGKGSCSDHRGVKK